MAGVVKAEDLVKLIRRRYPLNRPNGFQTHVVLEQVPDGTGMYQGHWIDAVVFDLWPSKGLLRSAFEVKVSRSDFLRELQNPVKHKWAMESFHEFWFVAPQNVIQLPELPANVGWLCPRGGKLTVKRYAVQNPEPKLDNILLAAFMRAAAKEISRVSRVTAKDILDGSEEYRIANLYKDATITFMNQRGAKHYRDPSNPEELLGWLSEATMDNQLIEDREQLLRIAGRFQREIVCLLNIFLIIANKSLLARNELGQHIVNIYGGEDSESVEALKKVAEESKKYDAPKRYLELVKLVLNWENELGSQA